MMPMMRWARVAAWLVCVTPLAMADGSAEAGATKAATCIACHGPNGNSVNPQWPNLGRPERGLHRRPAAAFSRQDAHRRQRRHAADGSGVERSGHAGPRGLFFARRRRPGSRPTRPTGRPGEALSRRRSRTQYSGVHGLSRAGRPRQSGRRLSGAARAARGLHRRAADATTPPTSATRATTRATATAVRTPRSCTPSPSRLTPAGHPQSRLLCTGHALNTAMKLRPGAVAAGREPAARARANPARRRARTAPPAAPARPRARRRWPPLPPRLRRPQRA